MARLLRILVFLGLSLPLTWVWLDWGQRWYGRNFGKLALPIYGLFGATSVMPMGSRQRFINYLPFLILMLVTHFPAIPMAPVRYFYKRTKESMRWLKIPFSSSATALSSRSP